MLLGGIAARMSSCALKRAIATQTDDRWMAPSGTTSLWSSKSPQRRDRLCFIGPADCNNCNRNHKLFQNLYSNCLNVTRFAKRNVVIVAVVTVCWSYECYQLGRTCCYDRRVLMSERTPAVSSSPSGEIRWTVTTVRGRVSMLECQRPPLRIPLWGAMRIRNDQGSPNQPQMLTSPAAKATARGPAPPASRAPRLRAPAEAATV